MGSVTEIEALKKILEWYEKEYPKRVEEQRELFKKPNPEEEALKFMWNDVGVYPTILAKLVSKGFLKIVYKSRKYTEYKPDIEKIKQYLQLVERQPEAPKRKPIDKLFENIVGYEDIKKVLRMIIEAEESLHCLLIGPPATAKSLFLEEIYNYYGNEAEFIIGSQASSAGLGKIILERQPKVIIIDEIDKILKSEDLSILLSVMEKGFVRRVKGDYMTDLEQIKVKVFAAGNVDNLPSELRSRFKPFIFYFRPYTKQQFIQVCINYFRDLASKEIIEYAANRLYDILGNEADVRAVRNLLLACKGDKNKNKIDSLLEVVVKYSKPSKF